MYCDWRHHFRSIEASALEDTDPNDPDLENILSPTPSVKAIFHVCSILPMGVCGNVWNGLMYGELE